jgi:hypothetical protein
MKSLPKDKRDKIIAIAIGTVLAVGAICYLLIGTQRGVLKKRASQITAAQKEVDFAQRLVSQSEKIELEMESAEKRLEQIEGNMVSGDMYSWIIKTMNRFLVSHRVDIPTFTPPGLGGVGTFPEAQFPYKAATFAISGTAHFHEFGRFVAEFENQFPCARVQNLQLEPLGTLAAKADSAEKTTFKLEIVALIKPATTL